MHIRKIRWILGGLVLVCIVGLFVLSPPQSDEPTPVREENHSPVENRVRSHTPRNRSSIQSNAQQTVASKVYVIPPPNPKSSRTLMINGQEVEIYEGENRIYIFKEGVESPRPLTDEERRRLLQLRDLMRDPATPKEERAAYAIETQRILKNTRRSGYTEGVIRFGRISPEILNLPREERDKRLLAEAQERHNRLLQEALARDGDIGDIHGKSGHNENFDPLSPDPSGEGVGFGVPDDQMAVPGDAPERWSLETPPSDLGLDEDISEEELLRQIEAALKRDAAKKGEYDERQGRHPSAPTIVPERPPSQFNREAPDIPKRRGRRNSPDRETPPTKE